MSCTPLNTTPDDASRTQQDVLDVLILSWGSNAGDRYPQALDSVTNANAAKPAFPFSPAGVVIGPLSTVDRCWFSWNPMVQRLIGGQSSATPRCASFEAPIFTSVPAGDGTLASNGDLQAGLNAQLLYAFPAVNAARQLGAGDVSSTIVPLNYKKADGTQLQFWDDTAGTSAIAFFVLPRLHLQFLRRTPVLSPGTKRFPFEVRRQSTPAGDGAEHPMIAVPVFGRKNITVSFHGDQANITYRVAALRGIGQLNTVPQETTEGSTVVAAANATGKVQLTSPGADYIIVYGSCAVAPIIETTIVATD